MKQELIDTLHREGCSLVVSNHGVVKTYRKKGVRDLEDLLLLDPQFLRGAQIADKVTGKAAAGMVACGGVVEIYADVMSKAALPVLRQENIKFTYGQLVDRIVTEEGDDRCPLEEIVAPARTASEIVQLLHEHFAMMKKRQ